MKMDFKSLINKISSMDDSIETPKAPVLPQAVQLNEDAQLRVLAGTSSYVAEAKKKAEEKKEEKVDEVFDADAKVGDKKKTAKGVATKTATGLKHEKTYAGDDTSDVDDDEPAAKKKKAKKESIDPEAFKAKFSKMVEAKKEDSAEDKKKKEEKKKKIAKIVDEGAKPDFLDIDKDGDKKEPMKKAAADKGGDKKDGKKGMSAKQEKYFGKKNESAMMPKGKKRPVKESVEQKLTFKQMIQLVQESGGQQQIDPTDKELFAWAQRVASAKFTESTKQEVYAGLVYERMGGAFEMYDVLSEDQK
jgi:hypothetical protein